MLLVELEKAVKSAGVSFRENRQIALHEAWSDTGGGSNLPAPISEPGLTTRKVAVQSSLLRCHQNRSLQFQQAQPIPTETSSPIFLVNRR